MAERSMQLAVLALALGFGGASCASERNNPDRPSGTAATSVASTTASTTTTVATTTGSASTAVSSSAVTATAPADAGKKMLSMMVDEAERALSDDKTDQELDQLLDDLAKRVAKATGISDSTIRDAISVRERINRDAASHGPVPYPSRATAARIFGVPGALQKALSLRGS